MSGEMFAGRRVAWSASVGSTVHIRVVELSWTEPCKFTDGTDGYIATDARRAGCVGYGTTAEDAMASLELARVAYDASSE